jgi:ABC-2 type transport system ATP-binding protein
LAAWAAIVTRTDEPGKRLEPGIPRELRERCATRRARLRCTVCGSQEPATPGCANAPALCAASRKTPAIVAKWGKLCPQTATHALFFAMPVLEAHGLQKTFRRGFFRIKTAALRGISFSVEPGEIFGFLGPNGAGKTTTIKILMGLIFASEGSARVFGLPVGDRDAKRKIGYLPENPYFYDYLSSLELLDMVGRVHGLPSSVRRRRAHDLVERIGLRYAQHRPLRSFSKGMLQRVGLAQALMGDPELVVLDEPMSGLDPLGRKEVRDLVLELRRAGKTVFFSTHILSDATMLCDRVGIVVEGQLRDVGPLGQLLSPQVRSVDVVWSGPEDIRPVVREYQGQHETTSEGELFRTDEPEMAQPFIAAVLRHGGTILQVNRHRQSLEELFVSETKAHFDSAKEREP